jgi:hypothetical protein
MEAFALRPDVRKQLEWTPATLQRDLRVARNGVPRLDGTRDPDLVAFIAFDGPKIVGSCVISARYSGRH